MFVQVIHGRVSDPQALESQFDKWLQDLRPNAQGWLGATSGVTPDGRFISVVRFESEEAARRNSDRPEQGQWWAETEKLFDGQPTFHDYTNAETYLQGGSDSAGFVQVMHGRLSDPAAARELMREFDEWLPEQRPDVIGGTYAWTDDGSFTDTIYFESEQAAREGERRMNENEQAIEQMKRWGELIEGEIEYFDLSQPRMFSP